VTPPFVRLSYEIRSEHPGWPGNPTYSYEQISSTERGDVANFGMLHLLGHFGSHLDAPNHFNPDGIKVAQVPLDRFVYEHPVLLDVPKDDTELVTIEEVEPHATALEHADLLLLRTGWSEIRKSEPARYAHEGPGVSPEACTYLIDTFPGLKAIALDCISVAAYRRIDPDGILSHQILCGVGRGDRYVLIIEDLDLAAYPAPPQETPTRVYAIPLFPEGTDSSPCTVFAELRE
jgi:kynurenine formamidase